MVTRTILYLSCAVILLLFQPITGLAQTNSVVGIVEDTSERSLDGVEVFEVRHKDEINDITNENGLYCVKIPKTSPNYQLQYHKKEYMDHVDTEPIPNNVDPKKRDTIILLGSNDLKTLKEEQLRNLIRAQLATFNLGKRSKLPLILKATKANFELISDNINPEIKDKWKIQRELGTYIRQVDGELKMLRRE